MKKKILFIHPDLGGGGAEKVLIDILMKFDFESYDVYLCLLSTEGIYISDIPKDVKLISLFNKKNSIIERVSQRMYRHFRLDLAERLFVNHKVKGEFDVIISFLEGAPLRYHSYIVDKAKKNIAWVHTDLIVNRRTNEHYFTFKHELISYQKMDFIIAVSEQAKESFFKLFNISNNVKVVYSPIDKEKILLSIPEYSSNVKYLESAVNNSLKDSKLENIDLQTYCDNSKSTSKTRLTVCAVGRLHPLKSFDRLIRVAKMLKDDNYLVDYWIIGDGSLLNDLKILAKELDMENEIIFWGYQKSPYPFMQKADIFISTSSNEGFSLVVAEALCLGKPIISTKTTGPTELLGNGQYGILTDHDDFSIFEALKKLLDSPEERQKYGNLSSERSEIFSFSDSMNTIYSLLDS